MRIGIINYGMGNLGSIQNALESLGANSFIVDSPDMLTSADRIVLPGVGAFAAAMEHLEEDQWLPAIHNTVIDLQRPILGICLGMQLLFCSSDEGAPCQGLGLIEGSVKRLQLRDPSLRIPHMGWNEVVYTNESPIFHGIENRSDFYFVHSYAAVPTMQNDVIARTHHGDHFTVAVHRKNIFGVQFHPEKSSRAGRKLLQNFLEFEPC